ncbi:MAG: DNA polymerase III subunit delta [Rikenellaceae bacterium]
MAKISFKDTLSQFSSIKKDINAGKIAPIYVLMGEEGYFIDELVDILTEKILPEDKKAFNQIVCYGKDTEVGAVINMARQMPMMGGKQVVILREAQTMRGVDKLSLYSASPSPESVLVVAHKDKNIDKRSQFYKHVASKGVVFESVKPRDYELGDFLSSLIKSKGCTIDAKALAMLTEHLGVDISKISNELTKLLTFLPEGTTQITADHIQDNIGISKEFNNFELTKALSEKNAAKALKIAAYFAANSKNYPMLVTLGIMFTHFQRIFVLNYQKWLTRTKGKPMPSDMELCGMLKLKSPFFLTEYKQAAALYPNAKVFAILGLLREYDLKSKGMGAGSASEGDLMRELLLKIFMI